MLEKKIFSSKLYFLPCCHFLYLIIAVFSYAKIPGENIGSFYVNIGITKGTIGNGIDDAFAAEIKRIYPKTEAEVNQLKTFDYYDGVVYRWVKKYNDWRLLKYESGKPPVKISLYALIFSPAKKARYHMEIFKANPTAYKKYNLKENLQYLGIMGLRPDGISLVFDFISEYTPVNPDNELSPPHVYLSNVEPMFVSYINSVTILGHPTSIVMGPADEQVPHYLLTKGMGVLPGREQQLLDDYVAPPDKDIFVSSDGGKIPTHMDSPEPIPIKYFFRNIRPKTSAEYGSAKAVFFPVKVTVTETGKPTESFYPLFVFPSAFADADVLGASIMRELYHARWWNAFADIIDSDYAEAAVKLPREGILRTTLPHFENDIYKAINSGVKLNVTGSQKQQFYLDMRAVFLNSFERAIQNPLLINEDLRIPWTFNNNMIIPSGIHSEADIYYNTAISIAPWMDDHTFIRKVIEFIAPNYTKKKDLKNKSKANQKNTYLICFLNFVFGIQLILLSD